MTREIERAIEYPALNEKHLTRNDIIQGNINMLSSGAIECRRIGKLASAEEKEIIAEVLTAELEREKNEPLTEKELMERKGRSVWVKFEETGHVREMLIDQNYFETWGLFDSHGSCYPLNGQIKFTFYRYEPKGENE